MALFLNLVPNVKHYLAYTETKWNQLQLILRLSEIDIS
jgi:hypothetical protein